MSDSNHAFQFRAATILDRDKINCVYQSAFPQQESHAVTKLAIELLSTNTIPRIISLVAESDGEIVGHAAFSPVRIDMDQDFRGYILSPLAVNPDFQKRRVGADLITKGIEMLSTKSVEVLLVYGDPAYYSLFGFNVDAARPYIPPFELTYPFGWQGISLNSQRNRSSASQLSCVSALSNPALW